MKKSLVALIAITAAFGLAACSSSPTVDQPTEETEDTSQVAPDTEEVADEEEAPEFSGTAAFGDAATWPEGVTITVSQPEPFTPSEYSAGGGEGDAYIFTVTMTNGSDENFEPLVMETVTSGGTQLSSIIDMDQDLDFAPTATMLPGDTLTWNVGYNIPDMDSLRFQIAPSVLMDEVIFTN